MFQAMRPMKWPDFHIGDALLVGGCGVVGLLWGLFATDNAFLHERAYPYLTVGGVIRAIVYWPFWLALGVQRLRGIQPYDDTRVVFVLGATAGMIVGVLVGIAIVFRSTRPPR